MKALGLLYKKWHITMYVNYSYYDTYYLLEELKFNGCDNKDLDRAFTNLTTHKLDSGLTFINPEEKTIISIIGHADSSEEYFNSFIHEVCHIANSITHKKGEHLAYTMGDISMGLFPVIKPYLCDKCGYDNL